MSPLIKVNTLILVLVTMLAQDCEKDAEKKASPKEKEKLESLEVKKATAGADWRKFTETAESQISIAKNQLKSLNIRISNMKGGQKVWLQNEYDRNSKMLANLEEELKKIDTQQPRAEEYNTAIIDKNKSFKSFFLREILEINNHLEHILEN